MKRENDQYLYLVPYYDQGIGTVAISLQYALYKAYLTNHRVTVVRKNIPFPSKKARKQLSAIFNLNGPLIRLESPLKSWMVGSYYGLLSRINNLLDKCGFGSSTMLKPSIPLSLMTAGYDNMYYMDNSIPGRTRLDMDYIKKVDWQKMFNTDMNVRLSEDDEQACRKNLIALRIPESKWYVCLHVRTSNHYQDHNTPSEHRNATFDAYRSSIEYINSKGGVVVRLGDQIEQDLSGKNIIDYPDSKYKSEVMDLYLIKNCRFFFGSDSGLCEVAYLFGVPVLSVNVTDFLVGPRKDEDILIYKHILSRKTGKRMQLEEIYSNDCPFVNSYYFSDEFTKRYEYTENSWEEIKEAVCEMLLNLDSGTSSRTAKQSDMNTMARNATLKWVTGPEFRQNTRMLYAAYLMATRMYWSGTIGRHFIENSRKSYVG